MNRQGITSTLPWIMLSFFSVQPALAYPALPTRDQTPLLQAYFIPAVARSPDQGWAFTNSLYITNTYQLDQSHNENLLIDVENLRFDFQASYAQQNWLFNLNIPLIRNSPGFLDQTIRNWHDFFGLPQGGRDQAQNDQLHLLYQNSRGQIFDLGQNDSGFGDIQLAAGYRLTGNDQLWLGVEVSASSDPLLSSQSTDFALWYAHSAEARRNLTPYGMIGLSFPADGGLFKHQLNRQFAFGQLGLLYAWRPAYQLLLQTDFHRAIVKHSGLDALGDSLQAQFGLRMARLSADFQLDVFFSEDIYPGHAPDITFGIRLSPRSQSD